jgi:hypothetical protein
LGLLWIGVFCFQRSIYLYRLTSNYSCVRIRARSSNEFSSWKKTQTLFPEVLAISLKDDQIIVIVDQAKAKLYLRINSLVEAVKITVFRRPGKGRGAG